MDKTILENLKGREGNYIMPFFWQHGETEETLREYMGAIYNCGIRSVCVESRPHPDFAGPKWWADMDVILDEARRREMKVWILDDSHFPTGYANGALENAEPALCRQSLVCQMVELQDGGVELDITEYLHPRFTPRGMEQYVIDQKSLRTFDDDRLLSVTALGPEGETVPLEGFLRDGLLRWQAPAGKPARWRLCFCVLTRNLGPHRSYINMMSAVSCRRLIDAVYEPHYAHYREDFGKTIAGFFSDEPELGNGHLYESGNVLGTDQDLPWSSELETALLKRMGQDWKHQLFLLWDHACQGADPAEKAKARYAYMDAVTTLVEKNFSFQLGDWCRDHGVEYIGHLIEDNNQHARTGSSLGHYFRGLGGQDMAGIDDIGGQVLPQGEDLALAGGFGAGRDGEFFHYALGALGASLGAVDPLKKGRAMCEIFGAYGWSEGVRLEKYLADHFMVRGVNRFVPHAFSGAPYPDPDCPPHFYAHGNNPQYRHFGALMRYMNRVCGLIDGGQSVTPAAILYHGEAEWTGEYMLMQKPARLLCDRQIGYTFLPSDVFGQPDRFGTKLGKELEVNGRRYQALIVPYAQFVSADFVRGAADLKRAGCPVIFVGGLPQGVYDGEADLEALRDCTVVPLEGLIEALDKLGVPEISIFPGNSRLRYLHYQKDSDLYLFVNEGTDAYVGEVAVPQQGECYAYNAWENRLETVAARKTENGTALSVRIEPLKSLIVVFGSAGGERLFRPLMTEDCVPQPLPAWKRSLCRSIDYPAFDGEKDVTLPDDVTEENPEFSGFVRYEATFSGHAGEKTVLEISQASEGVETFLNGVSMGIQIAPPFRFDLTGAVKTGENALRVEVASTAARDAFQKTGPTYFVSEPPVDRAGITGTAVLWGKKTAQ